MNGSENNEVIGMNNTIHTRRSIRKFLNKPVPRRMLEQLIDAARAAPSAKNRQPWKYIVFGGVQKQQLLECMQQGIQREMQTPLLPDCADGISDAKYTLNVMRQAPIVIIVLNVNGRTPFSKVNTGERITEICDTLSIGASIQNILLTATQLGLGTLWIANTCFAYPELTAYLKTDCQLVGAVAVGYAAESPGERPRKNVQDTVAYQL